MNIYYRISDKSYDKVKLPGADKTTCLMNFISVFRDQIFVDGPDTVRPTMRIIADNCERKTNKLLMDTGIPVTMSNKGNAGSFKMAIELAAEEGSEDDIVYFVEDDYLHLHGADKLISEGLRHADYVTLYDHPDKYTKFYDGGEESKVIKTVSSHWRYTISTCLTFATTVKTLREDKEIWLDKLGQLERAMGVGPDHPHDHRMWQLLKEKGRRLILPIPGQACHVDLTFSGTVSAVLIEPWAIEMMIEKFLSELPAGVKTVEQLKEIDDLIISTRSKNGWHKLIALDALYQEYK